MCILSLVVAAYYVVSNRHRGWLPTLGLITFGSSCCCRYLLDSDAGGFDSLRESLNFFLLNGVGSLKERASMFVRGKTFQDFQPDVLILREL